jgi:hypothetical protein
MSEDEHDPGVIRPAELTKMLPELLALFGRKQDAADAFAAGVDAAAYRSGAPAGVIRKLVTAMARDKARDALDDAEALSALIQTVIPELAQ